MQSAVQVDDLQRNFPLWPLRSTKSIDSRLTVNLTVKICGDVAAENLPSHTFPT
jgi:hypothetical protein